MDERLDLLNLLTLSLSDELAPQAQATSSLDRIQGIGEPNGEPPSDSELHDDYVEYLLRKYS